MKNERINQITESLQNIGPKASVMYTNQEIIDLLKELQAALAKGVFEKTHAENLRDRDILIHFEALAKEYGLDTSNTYRRFAANMTELGYTIGSFIKGMNGEKIARRALKLLSFEKGTHILYNVELEDEDAQAEYDAIVVAPYGMFVVEVKNWGAPMVISPNGLLQHRDGIGITYDLPGRMSIKEALLRECLGELFPENYHNMLLLSNEKAQCEDNYRQIPVSFGGGISYEIKRFNRNDGNLTEQQTAEIVSRIRASHKEQKALCTVKCDEIIEDFATLMWQIEAASSGLVAETVQNEKKAQPEAAVEGKHEQPAPRWWKRVKWDQAGQAAAGIAAVIIPGLLTAAVRSYRK